MDFLGSTVRTNYQCGCFNSRAGKQLPHYINNTALFFFFWSKLFPSLHLCLTHITTHYWPSVHFKSKPGEFKYLYVNVNEQLLLCAVDVASPKPTEARAFCLRVHQGSKETVCAAPS